MNLSRLMKDLTESEGRPARTYLDTKNILTGGIGHNLIAKPESGFDRIGIIVPDRICERWFNADIQESILSLDRNLPWWRQCSDARQNALLDLCFNMGWGGLSTFKNTLAAFESGAYATAANGIRNSQYAKDVGPRRSGKIANMIQSGLFEGTPDFADVISGNSTTAGESK